MRDLTLLDHHTWTILLHMVVTGLRNRCVHCMVTKPFTKDCNNHTVNFCRFFEFWDYVDWKRSVTISPPVHGYHCTICLIPHVDHALHPKYVPGNGSALDQCPN